MIEELLPCPWCGVQPEGIEYNRGYRVIIYHAKWCPALDLSHRRKQDAIRLWNTRRAAQPREEKTHND